MPSKRTTIYLDDRDRQALRLLQDRYGMASLSDVIRFALRTLAAEHGRVSQKPVRPDFGLTGSESLRHSPVLAEPNSLSVTSTAAPASALALQGEAVEILSEKLRGTQEELALTQEELARTQDELRHTTKELQAVNLAMLEMSAASRSAGPTNPQKIGKQKAGVGAGAIALVSKQPLERLLQQSAPLWAENRKLLRQTQTELAKLHEVCSLVVSQGNSILERNGYGAHLH